MRSRSTIVTGILLATLALGAAPALASLSSEVNAGRVIAARVDSRQATCRSLSGSQLEHLGEYVMQRMLGSTPLHQAMDQRMEAMMGSSYADRMHQALGARYAGCAVSRSALGPGAMMGGGMMGGTLSGTGGWPAMMGSSYSWMRNGSWQHMNRADWNRALNHMMGAYGTSGNGWSTGAVLAAVLGALALGGLAAFALMRWPGRRHPSQPAGA